MTLNHPLFVLKWVTIPKIVFTCVYYWVYTITFNETDGEGSKWYQPSQKWLVILGIKLSMQVQQF